MQRTHRKRGCIGWGCTVFLVLILLLVVLVGWVAARTFRVPERLGLIEPIEERLLGGVPERDAGIALKAEMERSGYGPQGLTIAVWPMTTRDANLAVAVLDASQGFRANGEAEDLLLDAFQVLAVGNVPEQHRIGRVAIHYVDEEGRWLVSLTAPTETIRDYAGGKLDRDAFLKAIDGKLNVRAMAERSVPR